jgi:SET domain-containing protein
MILPFLTIASSEGRGRGVYTTEQIEAGTIIEVAPVIVLDAAQRAHVEKTLLYDYIFEWGEDLSQAAVALGYVSIYNHSKNPNCKYEMDFDFQTISIVTLTSIQVGEELFINYNAEEGTDPSWFNAI